MAEVMEALNFNVTLFVPQVGEAQACSDYISDSCLIKYLAICKGVSSLSLEVCKQIA